MGTEQGDIPGEKSDVAPELAEAVAEVGERVASWLTYLRSIGLIAGASDEPTADGHGHQWYITIHTGPSQ